MAISSGFDNPQLSQTAKDATKKVARKAYTKTIVVAPRGTPEWVHEQRHAWQEKHWKALSKWCEFGSFLRIIAFGITLLNPWAALGVYTLSELPELFFEVDAGWHTYKKTGRLL